MNQIEIKHYFSQDPNLNSIFTTFTEKLPAPKREFIIGLLGLEPPSMETLNFMLHLRTKSVEEFKAILAPVFEKYPDTFVRQLLFAPQLKKLLIFLTCFYLEISAKDRSHLNSLADGRLDLYHMIFCAAVYLKLEESANA